jgi:PAS domain S-box-containing protein
MQGMTHDSGGSFMPHGFCFLWRPDVLWLHVISDGLIALAYFCIPVALVYFVRTRRDVPFQMVFLLFGAFILLCGTTHILSIWVLWHPNYYFEGVVKAMTAVASIGTMIMTVRLMPQALAIPSPNQMDEANAQLREANAKLEKLYADSEERSRVTLAAIVDNAVDAIITIDEAGTIESANRACERLFGYGAAEIIGQNIRMLMPEPYQSAHDGYLDRYGQTGDARIIGTSGREVEGRRKDGSVFPIDLSVSAFTVDGKRHFTGIVRDITIAKQEHEARQRLLARLTESNTELERFAYVASHDMQEPLRMVLNFSQIIAADYNEVLDDEGKDYLRIVGDSAMRMRDMVQDLLEYARLGREGMSMGDVDMEVELNHVLTNLNELIRDADAIVTYDPLPFIEGNAVQIMRLLQNLIANAIKYQKPGNTPHVHVSVTPEGADWHFTVLDNGLGIDPAFVSQVFEPFRRLHTWEAIRGSGLGLAVCRKIVDSHGGRIWATSVPGEGSVFHFTIPKPDEAAKRSAGHV